MRRSRYTSPLRSVALAWLASLLLAAVAQAQSPDGDPLVEAREARYWLSRIHEAAGQRNFLGTFVVSAGGSVASARIAHFCDGRNQFERIESLDGQARQVYRHNDLVQTVWPRSRTAVVETRQAAGEFPALLSSGAERIVEFYNVKRLGEGRVAGHEANVLLLRPKDGFRFGYRLWAEKGSGLLLRAELFDERDVVLEAAAFSNVVIGVKAQPELVLAAMKRLDGYRVKRPLLEAIDLEREGWTLRQVPPGFRHVSSVRRSMSDAGADGVAPVLQTIYSDGLTHVSLFIEPYDAGQARREVLMALGATQTLARRQGEWWLTVIGDVPAATLRAFAAGLERRR
jgi:sigma-E factor negative regulatory protein RseB